MKKIKKWFIRVLGMHDRTLSAEKKLFLAMNFGCLPALVFSVVINIINRFPPEQNVLILLSSGFYLFTYYIARFRKNYAVSMRLFFTVSWLLISSGWFYGGGIAGTIPIFFIYFLVMSMLCLERKDYRWLLPLCVGMFIICYSIELLFPESVARLSEETKIGDYIATTVMGFFLLAFVIYYFKKSFDRDRRRLKRKHIMLTEAWEKLKAENKRAEDALSVKNQFLANISHEIRTPLSGILGYSEILLDTEMNETQIQYLSVIRKSGNLLLSIVNDILDISKIESGKMQLEFAVFNLREIVEDTSKLAE
ncbi:MAG TPA: histidine kinase dimerization/phospho-acceptor domain-containing protein, partial [Leptospiraceae bacterium]|nr:histidine kinase dimerization/phospho-acceptor domain-containing protein [Leptospiraceae bacterium]